MRRTIPVAFIYKCLLYLSWNAVSICSPAFSYADRKCWQMLPAALRKKSNGIWLLPGPVRVSGHLNERTDRKCLIITRLSSRRQKCDHVLKLEKLTVSFSRKVAGGDTMADVLAVRISIGWRIGQR